MEDYYPILRQDKNITHYTLKSKTCLDSWVRESSRNYALKQAGTEYFLGLTCSSNEVSGFFLYGNRYYIASLLLLHIIVYQTY